MATLTKSTGTVALSGAVEKVTLPAVYGWVWVKNMSDADMFVGLSDGVSAGADGVMRIPAGECGRVQTDGQDSVYLIGSGNALVVAQNYADCPFKVGGKGGEIPDLSAYAKTVDVPGIKVNEAVNADTVCGMKIMTDTITSNSDGAGYIWLPQGNGRKYISALAHGYENNMYVDSTTGRTNLHVHDAISVAVTIDITWLE